MKQVIEVKPGFLSDIEFVKSFKELIRNEILDRNHPEELHRKLFTLICEIETFLCSYKQTECPECHKLNYAAVDIKEYVCLYCGEPIVFK